MIIYLLHDGISMYRMLVFREAFKGYIKVKIPFKNYASCKRKCQTLLTFFACHGLWTYMAYKPNLLLEQMGLNSVARATRVLILV